MSRNQAIYDFCKMCIYDPKADGTWREQTEACTSVKSCPLWPYRPVSISTGAGRRTTREKTIEIKPVDIDALVAGLDDEMEEE